jgi:hypothetical protein
MVPIFLSILFAAALVVFVHPERERLLYQIRNWRARARHFFLGGAVSINGIDARGTVIATSELRAVTYRIPRKRRFFGLLEGAPLFAPPDDFAEWSPTAQQEWSLRHCLPVDLGVVGRRVITTAGVNYIRDAFVAHNGGADVQNMNFHDSGTGNTASPSLDSHI